MVKMAEPTSILSPTGMTHSIRRPKSPRVLRRPTSGLGSREPNRQETTKNTPTPPTRPESRGRNAPQTPGRSKSSTPKSSSGKQPQRYDERAREFVNRLETEKHVRGCVRGGFQLGRHMTECVAMTTDIYKSECANQDRGDDSMFLRQSNSTLTDGAEEDDYFGQDEEGSVNSIRQSPSTSVLRRSVRQRKSSAVAPSDEDDELMHFHRSSRASSLRASELRQMSREKRELGVEIQEDDISPRTSAVADPVEENRSLRDIRMDLFRRTEDGVGPTSSTGFYAPVPEVHVHDGQVAKLQNELHNCRQRIQFLEKQVQQSRPTTSPRRSPGSSINEEKLFAERIEIEKQLRQQISENTELQTQLKKQVEETEAAKKSADKWRLEARRHAKRARVRMGNAQGERSDTDEANTSRDFQVELESTKELLALKDESKSLCAKLEEANGEIALLSKKNKELQAETALKSSQLSELNEVLLSLNSEKERSKNSVEVIGSLESQKLRDEIEEMKIKLNASELKFQEASTTKTKLEEELTEVQDDREQLKSQVSRLLSDFSKTKEDAARKASEGDREVQLLVEQLRSTKIRLSESHSDIVKQAALHSESRRQLHENLLKTRQEADILKQKVLAMDEEIARSETNSRASTINGASITSLFRKSTKSLTEADNAVLDLLRQRMSNTTI